LKGDETRIERYTLACAQMARNNSIASTWRKIMALGPHKIEYEVIEGWEQMPDGWSFTHPMAYGPTTEAISTWARSASKPAP
jgi:hypothetical protein